ncbi:MAG: acyl-CoA/acyl-ACP dehydrogenase [bacterium]|nr:acyl-CoA/acyl-ACP dehydrogenase [bacterium]
MRSEEGLVSFVFDSEQVMLRDTVRSFLADKAPMASVRTIMETDAGFDVGLWADLAELGMLGIHIPEQYGGAGFTAQELGLVMEELGRALTPLPFLSSVVLGAGVLLLAGSGEQKSELLPSVANGEARLALAATESDGAWTTEQTTTTAIATADTFVLSGTKSFVVDGHTADRLIVTAREDNGDISMFLVESDRDGVSSERLETLDMTRRLATVSFDDVVVPVGARVGSSGAAAETIERLYDLAVVALAAEQVGGAQACLEAAVEYAKVRHQFGRPIGSFQAVKHKCADMLVQVESAKSAAYHASWAAAHDPQELLVAAPLAKSCCSEAYFNVAADNIQVHGGIGFTWEHDAHLYFKRAKSTQLLFGEPAAWRATLADRIGV